jgi:uncharacterized protein
MTSDFQNAPIDVDNLQDVASIQTLNWQPLAVVYPRLNLYIGLCITAMLVMAGVLAHTELFWTLSYFFQQNLSWLLGLVSLLSLFFSGLGYLGDTRKRYALREQDLHFSSGLLFRKIVSQPISRIQHIELKRGPFERRAGLATLEVYSAGGSQHTFEVPGLEVANAEHIRQYILQHQALITHG